MRLKRQTVNSVNEEIKISAPGAAPYVGALGSFRVQCIFAGCFFHRRLCCFFLPRVGFGKKGL